LDVPRIDSREGGILLRKDEGLYRPTVRYEGYMKDYIEELFRATHLDRNTLFRAALFFFGMDGLSKQFLLQHLVSGKELPSPLGEQRPKHEIFMKGLKIPRILEGGRDVPAILEGGTSAGVVIKIKGGIKYEEKIHG
jgi:hypothetical protein